jgi:hypothetical protein
MPRYLVTNFNFEMIASTVTHDQQNFTVKGNFRTDKDLAGLTWETKDNYSHPELKYPTDPDFSDVVLEYDYNIEGHTNEMDSSNAPSLTVETNSGEVYYVRLWNYVVNRSIEYWENSVSSQESKEIRFPENRVGGEGNGKRGHIRIDFNNLYAGWSPYVWDSNWKPDQNWKKIPVEDIKSIMWSFVPKSGLGSVEGKSEVFKIDFNNWKVSGNTFLSNEPLDKAGHSIRMTDDYDDIYHLTPERVVNEYYKLGYRKIINFYIGASHYYDKTYSGQKPNMVTDEPFNVAFLEWYKNYAKRLHDKDYELIQSISMESVDAPESWWQRTWDNQPATTGWTPTPHLLSFTNTEVKEFYKKYVLELANIVSGVGAKPIIQLGETWWWFEEEESLQPPCFYDQSTRDLYLKETGSTMYEFKSINESIKGHEEMLNWLSDKYGEFSILLRDTVKASYPNAEFTVLFFPPSVMDEERVSEMMSIVNFPKKQWKYPNLDFFMIEDYDYLITNQMAKQRETLTFTQDYLGYPKEKIHYFAGFVLNQSDSFIWKNINEAINNAYNQRLGEIYVWAYSQVKRDGWTPPGLLNSNYPSGTYQEPIKVSLTSSGSDTIIYTLDGSDPSLNNGSKYTSEIEIGQTTTLRAISFQNGSVINRTSLNFEIINSRYQLTELKPIEIYNEQLTTRFLFTPTENGTFRFYTKPINGFVTGTPTNLKLYDNGIVISSNTRSYGPYGSYFSKIESNLEKGKTYELVLSNAEREEYLKTSVAVEKVQNETRSSAITKDWLDIKDQPLTSLYDVNYYKTSISSLEPHTLDLNYNNLVSIENADGQTVKVFYPNGNFNTFLPNETGTYYVKFWSNGDYRIDNDLKEELDQKNRNTDSTRILNMQYFLQEMHFYNGKLTGVYDKNFEGALIAYKATLNKWDIRVEQSEPFNLDGTIDDRILTYAQDDVELGRDQDGSIYKVFFIGDAIIVSIATEYIAGAAIDSILLYRAGTLFKAESFIAKTSTTLKDEAKEIIPITLRVGGKEHIISVDGFTQKSGISGGHNMNELNKFILERGFRIKSKTEHPNIKGVYDIEYEWPKSDGKGGLLLDEPWKSKGKTVYDPEIISDDQIIEWGLQAMKKGIIKSGGIIPTTGRSEITGYAPNGLKFIGYRDNTTNEITNFFPVLD